MKDLLFPFDSEDPKFLNQGIWECDEKIADVEHVTAIGRVSTGHYKQNTSISNQLEQAKSFVMKTGYQVTRIVVVRESGLQVNGNPVLVVSCQVV